MAHPHEAAYLAAIDSLLDTAQDGKIASTEEVTPRLTAYLQAQLPGVEGADFETHQQEALRYLQCVLRTMGVAEPLPGKGLSLGVGPAGKHRPVLVATGVLAAAFFFKDANALESFDAWVIGIQQQEALNELLKNRYGISSDFVQVCQFAFTPNDAFTFKVTDLLTEAMVQSLMHEDLTEVDRTFRQALLRRKGPTRLWQMPDGSWAMPMLIPVSLVSVVAPFYWEHGADDELAMADAIGMELARALSLAEFFDFEVEVYCGHLHVDNDLVGIAGEIVEDLESRGGKQVKTPVSKTVARLNKNVPCPCGSGQKYKKCCGV